ncbi:hypothetical protein KAM469_37070 [Aeromonas caviae]|nr:hypothetical protein KAM465_36370 [Aeromonas caviae]GKR16315.1 hypothetical protein KAM466_36330 [Aeromonas caviae]GKR20665.1 hypothetical protein KAM467_37090 [Aeromonas caviae]GKR24818.1 hypothetical protein KAM468_35580 [Aeromonas caviae]GKR29248.1 hypothetical protein KAM469_37070 [Aeromonas caviae]
MLNNVWYRHVPGRVFFVSGGHENGPPRARSIVRPAERGKGLQTAGAQHLLVALMQQLDPLHIGAGLGMTDGKG